MIVDAIDLQRKPSKEKTIKQVIHDTDERIVSDGIASRVLEYLYRHPGYSNSNRDIAHYICCGKVTIDRLVKEFVIHDRDSTLARWAVGQGYVLSKKKVGAYWRIAVEPYRTAPLYLDENPPEAQAHKVPGSDELIYDVVEFYSKLEQPEQKDRPSLEGLSIDQQLDTNAAYGGWSENMEGDQ